MVKKSIKVTASRGLCIVFWDKLIINLRTDYKYILLIYIYIYILFIVHCNKLKIKHNKRNLLK